MLIHKILPNYDKVPFRGINLAGAEFDYEFQLPALNDGAFYAASGMNTIRLPFKWEYLQSNSTDLKHRENNPAVEINFNNPKARAYLDRVKELLAKKMVVILDMHNYMRYGKPEKIIGKDFSADEYAKAWVQIASQPEIKNNPNVMLDLMNEPREMSTQLVLDNYNTVIKALRAAGINNQVQLEGNGWSGAHSWTQNWYDSDRPQKSNAEVFIPSNIDDIRIRYDNVSR